MSIKIISTKAAKPILFARDGNLCAYCAVPLAHPLLPETVEVCPWTGGVAAVDGHRFAEVNHIVPRSAGGLDCLDNYELTCGPCNRAAYEVWKATAA